MASKRQIEANRKNAKRSTGPKTDAGKARSSRNARRHGLSQSGLEGDISSDALAGTIMATLADQSSASTVQDLARSRLRLSVIREVRQEMLAALLECPGPKLAKRLAGLERFEKAARAAQRRAVKRLLQAR
jgi:hypothetical protein